MPTVQVKRADIAAGAPLSHSRSPVGKAIRRATMLDALIVLPHVHLVRGGRLVRVLRLPDDVVQHVMDYDLGRLVEPIEFELEL